MKYDELLTVIIVTHRSDKNLLKNILNNLAPFFKILIIENSEDNSLKIFEEKFLNVKVYLVNNTGNGGGINQGLRLVKTKFAAYIDLDIEIYKADFIKFIQKAEEIKNFAMLVPNIDNKYNIKDMKECYEFTGCMMFFNLENLKDIGEFDENIFLYYEEIDFAHRCKILNKKIFLLPDVNILHKESSSVKVNDEKVNDLKVLRQWHFMWSKFYFFKKNFSYNYAIRKTLYDFVINLVKLIILFPFNKNKSKIFYARLEGLVYSMIGKKSSKRL